MFLLNTEGDLDNSLFMIGQILLIFLSQKHGDKWVKYFKAERIEPNVLHQEDEKLNCDWRWRRDKVSDENRGLGRRKKEGSLFPQKQQNWEP